MKVFIQWAKYVDKYRSQGIIFFFREAVTRSSIGISFCQFACLLIPSLHRTLTCMVCFFSSP